MAKLTNKLSNEQLDKLILESTQPMNSLGIQIPYLYFSKSVKLNWYDISISIENGYLSLRSGIEHAIKELEENLDYNDEVLNLAMISPNDISSYEEISRNIAQLAELVSDYDKKKTKEKILFVVMNWIFENQTKYDDPLRVVEIVYDDFDFPETIKDFVRYEPSSHTFHGAMNENIKRLYNNWQKYLIAGTIKYNQS